MPQGQVLGTDLGSPMSETPAPAGAGRPAASPFSTAGITLGPAPNLSPAGLMPWPAGAVAINPVPTGFAAQQTGWSMGLVADRMPGRVLPRPRTAFVIDSCSASWHPKCGSDGASPWADENYSFLSLNRAC